jgi:hypothetical protein
LAIFCAGVIFFSTEILLARFFFLREDAFFEASQPSAELAED